MKFALIALIASVSAIKIKQAGVTGMEDTTGSLQTHSSSWGDWSYDGVWDQNTGYSSSFGSNSKDGSWNYYNNNSTTDAEGGQHWSGKGRGYSAPWKPTNDTAAGTVWNSKIAASAVRKNIRVINIKTIYLNK